MGLLLRLMLPGFLLPLLRLLPGDGVIVAEQGRGLGRVLEVCYESCRCRRGVGHVIQEVPLLLLPLPGDSSGILMTGR